MASDVTAAVGNQRLDDDARFLALKANDLGLSVEDPKLIEHCYAACSCLHCACFAWAVVMLSAESQFSGWLSIYNWVQWLRGLPGLSKPKGDPLDGVKALSPLVELAIERSTMDLDVRRILQELEVDDVGCLPPGHWQERTCHRAAIEFAKGVLNDIWYPVVGVSGVAESRSKSTPRFDPTQISWRHRGPIRSRLRKYRNVDVIGLMRGINHELACALRGTREQKRTILLYLAADPSAVNATGQLRLDEEVRAIEAEIRASTNRDALELRSAWAVRAGDLSRTMLDYVPSIVHFGCHGDFETIELESCNGQIHSITHEAIFDVFRLFRDSVRLVVLNACHSASLANALIQQVDCAIGMQGPIQDQAAIVFASALYRAIASGRSVQDAFELGKAELALHNSPDVGVPQLASRSGIDPSAVFFTPRVACSKAAALPRAS